MAFFFGLEVDDDVEAFFAEVEVEDLAAVDLGAFGAAGAFDVEALGAGGALETETDFVAPLVGTTGRELMTR